jgi:hypothetical protein
MSDKIGKYYWVKTENGREIAFKRDSGHWEMHGIDCLEDCKEAIIEVYGEVANSATMGEKQCNLPDFVQQREQFYNFITWYNAKPFIKKPKDGLITITIIEEYLKL